MDEAEQAKAEIVEELLFDQILFQEASTLTYLGQGGKKFMVEIHVFDITADHG